MFINCSNHASALWGDVQRSKALEWGEIVDIPFPSVPAEADESEVEEIAHKVAAEIIELKPDAVMCQGEFTLTYQIIQRLRENGVIVVAACNERRALEKKLPNGIIQKVSEFEFIRFRRYF